MERIDELVKKCIGALQKAPKDISDKLVRLFRKLSDFLKEHPEDAEKALPILLELQRCIMERNYVKAFEKLFLLLVLIKLRRRKK